MKQEGYEVTVTVFGMQIKKSIQREINGIDTKRHSSNNFKHRDLGYFFQVYYIFLHYLTHQVLQEQY